MLHEQYLHVLSHALLECRLYVLGLYVDDHQLIGLFTVGLVGLRVLIVVILGVQSVFGLILLGFLSWFVSGTTGGLFLRIHIG